MEVVEPAEAAPPVFEFPSLQAPAIRLRAWIGSLAVHAAVIALMLAAPREMLVMGTARQGGHVALVAPPRELTQTAPNRAPVGREFSLDNLVPRPPLRVPTAIPPMSRLPEPPPVRQAVVLPAPRAVDNAGVPGPPALGTAGLPAPPPQIQPEEKPKLVFETPVLPSGKPKSTGLGKPGIAPPPTSVSEATRAAIRDSAHSVAVGDFDLAGSPGLGGGILQAPSPGRPRTLVELASDPMGVDFKPYLIQILATVKRNWLAVYPESARLGLAGRVQIQFAIDRNGYIPKLVIALPSGAEVLDRAAVAGISASNPFPPLPTDFKGSQVRLQFTFSYNLK
jgi:TonB family protein